MPEISARLIVAPPIGGVQAVISNVLVDTAGRIANDVIWHEFKIELPKGHVPARELSWGKPRKSAEMASTGTETPATVSE